VPFVVGSRRVLGKAASVETRIDPTAPSFPIGPSPPGPGTRPAFHVIRLGLPAPLTHDHQPTVVRLVVEPDEAIRDRVVLVRLAIGVQPDAAARIVHDGIAPV